MQERHIHLLDRHMFAGPLAQAVQTRKLCLALGEIRQRDGDVIDSLDLDHLESTRKIGILCGGPHHSTGIALRGMMAARLGIIDQVTADEVARAAREELGAEEECVYEWLGLVVEVLVEVELSE